MKQTLTVYRFHPMVIFRGGGYPIKSVDCTGFSKDLLQSVTAFQDFDLSKIDFDELEEMRQSNKDSEAKDRVFILAEVEAATISKEDYKLYLEADDDELIGYACDFDFKPILSKATMPTGGRVPKKLLNSIYAS